jgi:hypothetical protein
MKGGARQWQQTSLNFLRSYPASLAVVLVILGMRLLIVNLHAKL